MLHARPFVGGVPLYRQVQSGIEDMIRANPRAKAIPLRRAARRALRREPHHGAPSGGRTGRRRHPLSHPGPRHLRAPEQAEEKLTLNSFLDAWTPKAGGFNVRVAALERVPADDSVAENLAIRPGAEVVYIRRLRLQNETIVAIDDRYMRAQDCSRIRRDIATSSLADYLRNGEGIEVDHGEMEIEARAPVTARRRGCASTKARRSSSGG